MLMGYNVSKATYEDLNSSHNNLLTAQGVSGAIVGSEQTFTFANNAVVDTTFEVTIPLPTDILGKYKIVVYNPSTVTSITMRLFAVRNIGGASRDSFIYNDTVPAKATARNKNIEVYEFEYEGLCVGGALKIAFTIDTALGATDGFTGYVQLVEV